MGTTIRQADIGTCPMNTDTRGLARNPVRGTSTQHYTKLVWFKRKVEYMEKYRLTSGSIACKITLGKTLDRIMPRDAAIFIIPRIALVANLSWARRDTNTRVSLELCHELVTDIIPCRVWAGALGRFTLRAVLALLKVVAHWLCCLSAVCRAVVAQSATGLARLAEMVHVVTDILCLKDRRGRDASG